MREEKILKLISSALDGELSPMRSAFVIRKVETDLLWKEKYEELSRLKGLLSDIALGGGVELSVDFDRKLKESLAKEGLVEDVKGVKGVKNGGGVSFDDILSRILIFFDRRVDRFIYGLAICSLLFLMYVGFEVYLGFRSGGGGFGVSSGVESSEGGVGVYSRGISEGVSGEDIFTTVIKSDGELFVNKDNKTVVIDIYSGELKGDLDVGSERLLRNVISNIEVYRKIYLDHYKPSKDFERVRVPVDGRRD